MKWEIAGYVSSCLTCQRVKFEHKKHPGLLHPLNTPRWKWEHLTMDFVFGLPKTRKQHDTVWVIVNRLTKSHISFHLEKIWDSLICPEYL